METELSIVEHLLAELRHTFRPGTAIDEESKRHWRTLAAMLMEDTARATILGHRLLANLNAGDTFAEETIIFIAKTLRPAGDAPKSFELLFEALSHPHFRDKERVLTWIDDMDEPDVQSAYILVIESFISGDSHFTVGMATLSINGLGHSMNDKAAELALPLLDDEESQTFSAVVAYLIKTRQLSKATALARAIHHGGSKEEIFQVLSTLRAWKAKETLPALREMMLLDWVNLERTQHVKSELVKTISALGDLP